MPARGWGASDPFPAAGRGFLAAKSFFRVDGGDLFSGFHQPDSIECRPSFNADLHIGCRRVHDAECSRAMHRLSSAVLAQSVNKLCIKSLLHPGNSPWMRSPGL
ncbi:hypothetical protein Veis_3242 [Verminephrobacter eiseniae EF01-2]|uniref:Uncharacterized protein n=1 Tax=Verminephrobacter eiseniae (strain EF01-2) TaxID=391735 RepID=A1WMW5_VEREI|nr:hypothetical protein Veis_3242 [Verminephrobacter eiseniae EF01-2]